MSTTSFPLILNSIVYLPSMILSLSSLLGLTVLVTSTSPSLVSPPKDTVTESVSLTASLIPTSPLLGISLVISLAKTLIGVIKSEIIIAISNKIFVNFLNLSFIF